MVLKVDGPELQEIVAAFRRDKDGISIVHVAAYERETGRKLGKKLGPPNNIISADKVIEMLDALYPSCSGNIPVGKVSSHEEARAFLGRLAVHAVDRLKNGNAREINDLFIVIEMILLDGTTEARDLIICYFLEDFQTIFFNQKMDIGLLNLKPSMHYLSISMWYEIDQYWKAAAAYICPI